MAENGKWRVFYEKISSTGMYQNVGNMHFGTWEKAIKFLVDGVLPTAMNTRIAIEFVPDKESNKISVDT